MKGNITRRGRNSWRLKFDRGRDANGKRLIAYMTVRGKRSDAYAKLAEQLAAVGKGTFVEPSKLTVIEHVRARLAHWKAAGEIGDKTHERYSELVENQIARFPIANLKLQVLKAIDVEAWHTTLRTSGNKRGGGIAAKTIGHAHRVLSKALREAVKFDLTVRNAAGKDGQTAPRAETEEVEIIPPEKIPTMLSKLRGRAIYDKVVTSLFTGLRRGELLALRWCNVDLDGKTIRVREALEETKAHGVRFKATKTKSGRREVSLPDIVVDVLRDRRRRQLERRLALGLGKLPDDALVFPARGGGPRMPTYLSTEWRTLREAAGVGAVTWHALRHTHASQLTDANVDIVTISKRLGHKNPNITLQIYAHLFKQRDDKAAAAINAALAGLGTNS